MARIYVVIVLIIALRILLSVFFILRVVSIFLLKCWGSWKEVGNLLGILISSFGCSFGDLFFGLIGWLSFVVFELIERVFVDSDDGLFGFFIGDC